MVLAFAYDGSLFDSFARQPRRRTVEGELVRVLRKAQAFKDVAAARFEVASRTDAGVSAAWNVCAFDSTCDPRRLAHIKHDVAGLWFLSAAGAEAGFSPRRMAVSKRYVYHVDQPGLDWGAMERAASGFVGLHDFHNYCRADRGVPTLRSLTMLTIEPGRLVFEAPNFLWEQVRRITQALIDVGRGDASAETLRARLGPQRDPQAPASAQGLVLEEVRLPVRLPAPSKSTSRVLASSLEAMRLRARFYEVLAAKAPTVRR